MTLTIGSKVWVVEVVPDIREEMLRVAGPKHDLAERDLDGCVDSERGRILISGHLSDKDRASTLLHEIFHIISPGSSEVHVRRLERFLFPILWRQQWKPNLTMAYPNQRVKKKKRSKRARKKR